LVDRRPEGGSRPRGYVLGFGFTAFLLGAMTLIMVLVILPRRYVLNAGLRESGISFPSKAAPFIPPQEVRREAPLPPPPPPATEMAPRGAGEIFWEQVEPLLRGERSAADALPLFRQYLEAHPEDQGVLREYAVTLTRAGRGDEAAEIFGQLLPDGHYPGVRLLLARTLRDLDRLDEASRQYASLVREKPGDMAMALEWARALSWGKEYDEAGRVLAAALAEGPAWAELQAELAQVYYWSGRLEAAAEILSGMEPEALERTGALPLRDNVMAALTPPETEPVSDALLPTPLERAVLALAEEDFEGAAVFYREGRRS